MQHHEAYAPVCERVDSSIQQISGGVAAYVAGLIVFQSTETSPLQNYDLLGLVVAASIIITMILIWFLDQYVTSKSAAEIAKAL